MDNSKTAESLQWAEGATGVKLSNEAATEMKRSFGALTLPEPCNIGYLRVLQQQRKETQALREGQIKVFLVRA